MVSINLTDCLYRDFFGARSVEDLFERIIKSLQDADTVGVRIILINAATEEIQSVYSGGIKSDVYAYLDPEILAQLRNRSRLYVPDSLKFRNIKFIPGEAYPRSILGFSFPLTEFSSGVVWLAFDKKIEIKKSEIDNYEKALEIIQGGVRKFLDFERIKMHNLYFQELLDYVGCPLLVIDGHNQPIWMNKVAEKATTGKDGDQNLKIGKFLGEVEKNSAETFMLNGVTYQAQYRDISISEDISSVKILMLEDVTLNRRQNEIIQLLVEVTNQSLRSYLIDAIGYTKMLPLIGELNPKQLDFLEKIQNKTENVLSDISDLFSIQRVTSENGIKIERLDLYTIIDDSIQLNRAEAVRNRVEMDLEMDEIRGESIYADRVLIRQAFYEIIKFAVLQTGLGRIVRVNAQKKEGGINIEIVDSGKGFSQVDIEQFPYGEFQNRDLNNLLLIWKILKLQNATFELSSKLGEGSTYQVNFFNS